MSLRIHPLALALLSVFAVMSVEGAGAAERALGPEPAPGERLSAWALRVHGPLADTTALHWHAQSERQPQHLLREAVLAGLESARQRGDLSAQAHETLSAWLLALPVTGRLTLATHDPRALQVMPESDPQAGPGHSFVHFARPTQVVVLNSSGLPCLLRHQPGAWAQDYLQACARLHAAHSPPVDTVWVAQADGRVQSFGVAPWNLSPQYQPSPGAWIWAPERNSGLGPELSSNLARLLATQAPPDAHPALQGHSTPAAAVALAQPNLHHEPRGPVLTGNDWGELGLLQTPSARMGPAGTVRTSISRVQPYTRLNFMLQPLDWLQFGFRYTDIGNRLYGPAIAGDQSLKDKSIDLKLRLSPESATWPAIALGVRDIGGTGLFASEYLVASKRWGNWDASLGLGWGNMGSRGNVSNPLRLLGSRFEQRAAADVGQGGDFNLNKLFTGPAAVFGGVQWASPSSPWVFKAELDGNSFQAEPLDNAQPVDSPINLGVVYRWGPTVELALSWQRGNRVAFGLTLQGNLGQAYVPKLLDPALPALRTQMPPALPAAGWADVASEINRFTSWQVQSVRQTHDQALVVAEIDQSLYLEQRIERAIRVLHALAPASVRSFRLQLTRHALPLSELHIDRTEWLLQQTQALPPSQALVAQQPHNLAFAPIEQSSAPPDHWQANPPRFSAQWAPTFSQIIGGPDGFLLYQLGVGADAQWRLTQRTWVSGNAHLRLIDNFDRFNFPGHSELPRVRTYIREYVTSSRFTLPRLQVTHARHLGGNHYASVYAGLLESMYGGVGAEWLYRPFGRSWSFGVDINHVQQRGFRQDFSFRDYRVTTGHATLNWDTGWNDVHLKLQAGRYLAGDHGATLDISRTFRNGTSIGAWATLTDVPFAVFGEGSFDKGIYIRIPFDAMLPISTSGVANLSWQPLTRDGGARLNRSDTLFDLTQARSGRALFWRPAAPQPRRSAERTAYVLQEPTPQPFDDPLSSAGQLFDQVGAVPTQTWLWAGAAVLGSALLDRSADRWAARNQGGNWDRLGDVGNALPLAFTAGSALLATGIAGPAASGTAQTALLAGASALGASMAVRTLAGRSRPLQGQGSSHFQGPESGSHRSSFTSNHTALAFALVTPFARQHQMPWLYGLAAATALGRVQQREHWVSDTVGGALLGYGIGSLLSLQQENPERGPRVRLTAHSIHADWSF